MAFQDFYRMSSHAVIQNEIGQILLLKANYANCDWGLPGGALDLGETVHEALYRECAEELGCEIIIDYLSGIYYHSKVNSHAFIFKCRFKQCVEINLSHEHSDYAWLDVSALSEVQKIRVKDCLSYSGGVVSRAF